MKKLIFLLLLFPLVFGAADLSVAGVEYANLYSDSSTSIVFTLENTGDETAVLLNNNLTGFPNYLVSFAPSSINSGGEADIVFLVSIGCEPKGNSYEFYANFTYEDSTQSYTANSSLYSITVDSPLSVSLIEPSDLSSMVAIQTTEVDKLLYSVSNNGLTSINYNVSVSHDDSVFSKILTPLREYSSNDIDNEVFTLQSDESYLFSHSLIPILSGQIGSYSVILQDTSCAYNKEIIVLNYQIISSTAGPGFDLMVADESNIIIILTGLIILSVIIAGKKG